MLNRYLIAGVLLLPLHSHAALSWSSRIPENVAPQKKQTQQGAHAHGGHRSAKPFYLYDSEGAEVQLWLPTLVRRPLHVGEQGIVKITATGVLNYHMLYARRVTEAREELALRYHYLNGKPTGDSPGLLLGYRKGALDIVPSPLTREHQRYQSGRTAHYTLLFRNKPLASQQLQVTTSNGTTLELMSDENGHVSVMLPDDFKTVKAGRRANRPAEFVVSTSYAKEGVEFHTTLSADYYVDPVHWQSRTGGVLAMLAGFVGGLLVVRRSRKASAEVNHA